MKKEKVTRSEALRLIKIHCVNDGLDFVELESYSDYEIEFIFLEDGEEISDKIIIDA